MRRKFGENGKLVDPHGNYPVATGSLAKKIGMSRSDLEKICKVWVDSLYDEPSKEMYLAPSPSDKFPRG